MGTRFVVSIDPATGGGTSCPGFALWAVSPEKTELVDCGVLKVKGTTHWKRMRDISFALPAALIGAFGGRHEALEHIHCIIEGLPPTISMAGGGSFTNNNTVHLHHSVAVLGTCVDWASVTELPVITWKSFLRGMCLFDQYNKTDMNDAIIQGLTQLALWKCAMPDLTQAQFRTLFPSSKDAGLKPELWRAWSEHITESREKSAKTKASKQKRRREKV